MIRHNNDIEKSLEKKKREKKRWKSTLTENYW